MSAAVCSVAARATGSVSSLPFAMPERSSWCVSGAPFSSSSWPAMFPSPNGASVALVVSATHRFTASGTFCRSRLIADGRANFGIPPDAPPAPLPLTSGGGGAGGPPRAGGSVPRRTMDSSPTPVAGGSGGGAPFRLFASASARLPCVDSRSRTVMVSPSMIHPESSMPGQFG